MIHHVVLLKWKPNTTNDAIIMVTEGFKELAAKISEIEEYSFGPDIGLSGTNYDYALVAKFKNTTDFDTYSVHPEHKRFMDFVTSPIVASYGAVQYTS